MLLLRDGMRVKHVQPRAMSSVQFAEVTGMKNYGEKFANSRDKLLFVQLLATIELPVHHRIVSSRRMLLPGATSPGGGRSTEDTLRLTNDMQKYLLLFNMAKLNWQNQSSGYISAHYPSSRKEAQLG